MLGMYIVPMGGAVALPKPDILAIGISLSKLGTRGPKMSPAKTWGVFMPLYLGGITALVLIGRAVVHKLSEWIKRRQETRQLTERINKATKPKRERTSLNTYKFKEVLRPEQVRQMLRLGERLAKQHHKKGE